MKQSGSYPLVAAFSCQILRPKPQRDGMIAQFFAQNGEDSDQVNQLGLTKYLDSLVYVELWSADTAPAQHSADVSVQASTPLENLDQFSKILTPAERKNLEKKRKIYYESNLLLKTHNFLSLEAVWSKLGNPIEFQDWISRSPCCALSDGACTNQSFSFKIPGDGSHYAYAPLCRNHVLDLESNQLEGGIALLRLRQRHLIQLWAWEKLVQIIGLEEGLKDPNPQKVMAWAFEHSLAQFIPPNYLSKLS